MKLNIPTQYRQDIEQAAALLKSEGCRAVYLFGSLVTGEYTDSSDIDLGVTGLPPRKYIRTYSKLNNIMRHRFDLVDFDENKGLYDLLHSIGEVFEVR